jgi:AcrR family transcriptional regulator
VPASATKPLARETILDTTETVLRRYGPAKATVLDVSRALGVSHGTVYRHFATKAALVEAVTERWLVQVIDPLETVVGQRRPAPARLRRWFDVLTATKRRLAVEDPELFETYVELMDSSPDMVTRHTTVLLDQLTRIVSTGMDRGELAPGDPAGTARAVFHAMSRFHHPLHRRYWTSPDLAEHYDAVWRLVAKGLSPPSR